MSNRSKRMLKYSMFGLGSAGALLGLLLFLFGPLSGVPLAPAVAPGPQIEFARLPLAFEPNVGQTAAPADFLARGPGYALYLDRGTATFRVYDGMAGASFGLHLVDANERAEVRGQGKLPSQSHYLRGRNPEDWRRNVANYGEVVYRDVYPGTDLVYYGRQGQLEFDFRLAPAAKPQQIRLAFDGVTDLQVDETGALVLSTGHGDLQLQRPVAYQEIDGIRREVAASFELAQAATVGFQLGSYDPAQPLVIDPVIIYSSYLGGGGDEDGRAIAVDGDGNRYIAGSTSSTDFPSGGFSNAESDQAVVGFDVFVAKLNAAGTALAYATYIGGAGTDVAYDIAVDADGNVYLTGDTNSVIDFPLVNAWQNRLGGSARPNDVVDTDAFVIKLGSDGGTLLYSTYLGGYGVETSRAITLDSATNMYVGGSSTADDFPVQAALQPVRAAAADEDPSNKQGDGFVTKISANGASLVYSTYLGGEGPDKVNAIVVDTTGQAYLTGDTASDEEEFVSIPINVRSQGFQPEYGGDAADAFVAKLASSGASFVYFTYLGGGSWDRGLDLAVDEDGNAYITGFTSSARISTGSGILPGFPVTDGAIQGNNAGGVFDAFITKLNATGEALVYSTYLGGSGGDEAYAIALDSQKRPVVVGRTLSEDFPLENAVQHERLGDSDGFVTQLDPSGGSYDFSSYIGGMGDDAANNAAVDAGDIVHLVGTTASGNFPVVDPLQSAKAAGGDLFVLAVDSDEVGPDLAVVIVNNPGPVPKGGQLTYDVTIGNSGPVDATGILIRDTAEDATIVSASTTQGSCDVSGAAAVCAVGSIASGASATLQVTVSALRIGTASNTATLLRADQSDSDDSNNSATMESVVVDRSGEDSGSLSAVFLILMIMGLLMRRISPANVAE